MDTFLIERNKNSHKGTYGRVGLVGGSLGMTGSMTLASLAALKSGSGYVFCVIPKSLLTIMSIKLTESIIVPISDNNNHFSNDSIEKILQKTKSYDAIAIGMGMGIDENRVKLVETLIKNSEKPLLIDADGINCLKNIKESLLIRENIVITPHPNELANFLDIPISDIQANRKHYCEYVANKYLITVVLKGHQTLVASPNKDTYINYTGNPGMATAGSGDVLSGMITSFMGQGLSLFNAAKLGVYLHGLAGDFAKEHYNETSLIASDIVDNIYKAINYYKKINIIL